MPLSFTQAQEPWIVRSLISYLSTNVVTPYNTAVATTNYPTALGIELEWPDDPQKSPAMPVIIIEQPIDNKDSISTGFADGIVLKNKQFRLYCFPAVTSENKPSITAAATLRHYVDFALGTGLYIPIYDYTSTPVQSEAARISEARIVKPTKAFADLLAIEKHRFDYLLSIEYPVVVING